MEDSKSCVFVTMKKSLSFILLLPLHILLGVIGYIVIVAVVVVNLILFGLVRTLAVCVIRLKHKNVQLLSGLDIVFTHGQTSLAKCVSANIYCKGKVDIERIQTRLDKMAQLHPRLHSFIHEEYGYKFWMAEENFNIRDHVFWHNDVDIGNETQFRQVARKFHAAPLTDKCSPWHIDIVELKYPIKEVRGHSVYCMVATFHHAIADGHSILHTFLSAVHDADVSLPKIPKPKHVSRSVVKAVLTYVKAVSMVPLLFWNMFFYRSIIIDPDSLSGVKHCVAISDLETRKIKRVKNAMGTSFTCVLSSCALGALQKFFQRKRITLPVNLYNFCATPLARPDAKVELVNNFIIIPIQIQMREHTTPKERMVISKAAWASDNNLTGLLFFDLLAKVLMLIIPSGVGQSVFHRLIRIVPLSMIVAGHDANELHIFDNGSSMFKLDLNVNMVPEVGIAFNFFTQGDYINITFNMDTNLGNEEEMRTILNDVRNELLELDKALQ